MVVVLPLVLPLHRVHAHLRLHEVLAVDVVEQVLTQLQDLGEVYHRGWLIITVRGTNALFVVVILVTCTTNALPATFLDIN